MHYYHSYCKYFISAVFILVIINISALADTAWAADSGIITGSVVNVRSGPGMGYTVIGTVLKNTQVQIIQTQENWDKIQSGSLTGWVNSSLINTNTTTSTASVPGTATTAPRVLLNGKELSFEVPPVIENSRTLVPLRAIFEAMGAAVQWNSSTQTVTATKGSITVVLPINSSSPTINGVVYPLDTAAKIVNNRTIAPLRFVGEAFGGTVNWIEATRTVTISTPDISTPNIGTPEYEVTQDYIANNRSGLPLNPTGQVVHSTADPGATAQDIRNYFNNQQAQASTHAVIDWNSIIEMIPENEIAWHAGPTANSKFLSFEMCEPAADDPDRDSKFQEVWNRAVWYCAKTSVKYDWNTNDNIFSHNGVSNMYHETNHTDPYGYFATYGKTWDQFLTNVDSEISKLKNI